MTSVSMARVRARVLSVLALAGTLVLAACGGGGGGGGSTTPSTGNTGNTGTTYNLRAAFRNVLTVGGTWNLPDRSNASAVYTLSIVPQSAAAFPLDGVTYARSVSNTSLAGLKLPPADGTVFYQLSGDSVRVIGNQVQAECGANPGAATAVDLPTAASLGTAGTTGGLVYSLNLRPDCNPATAVGATTDTRWQLLSDSGIVLFCLNNSRTGSTDLASTCFEIDAAGTLLGRARFARGPANGAATFEIRNF